MRGTQCNKDTFLVAGKDESKVEFYSDVKWICLVHIASWLGVAIAVILAVYLTGKAACLWALLIPAFVTSSVGDKKKDQKDDVEEDNQGGQ